MPDDASNASPELPDGVELREGTDGLTPARIATLYRRAPLHRPTTRPEALRTMFANASLVLAAWQGEQLVGVARLLTDGVLHSYLCDLAVEPDVQRQGLGKALVNEVLDRLGDTRLVLRDSDLSTGFYEHLGFRRVENAWMIEN
jgi:ribosomal protein S18 acetylase RimI-like enzyme